MLRTSEDLAHDLDSILSPLAVKHSYQGSKGRPNPDPTDKFRTRFQQDRDRILHSKAFRRLKAKTQVFTPSTGDHFRDRLTHTLEVSQVARSLARTLSLNEDLAEVIALAHDLGHTPFGHAGEEALRECLKPFGLKFEHNEQSRRIVDSLNLNNEVLEGLQKHQTPYDQNTNEFVGATLEAQIVNFADEIAYHCHDLDDGLRSQLITIEQVEKLAIWQTAIKTAVSENPTPNFKPSTPKIISYLMKVLIEDLATQSSKNIIANNFKSLNDVYNSTAKTVSFSKSLQLQVLELRKFLYKNFYLSTDVTKQTKHGQHIITQLFAYYQSNLTQLPPNLQQLIESGQNSVIIIMDYISGMTDSYARHKYEKYALS
jgi:dGTPase